MVEPRFQSSQYGSRVHVLNCSTSLSYYKGWRRQPTGKHIGLFQIPSMHYSISLSCSWKTFPSYQNTKDQICYLITKKKKKSLWVYWIFKNLLATPCSLWDLMQELNPCRLHWTHEVLTTGPPGRFLLDFLKPFLHVCMLSCQNGVQLFTTLWTVAHQAPLSMGFSRQEHWSGLPGSPPGDLSNPGIKPTSLMSPALAVRFFTTNATWEAQAFLNYTQFYGLLNDIQVSMSR